MKTLLVMTVGQSDVQLVVDNQRHKLDGDTCGTLLDTIRERTWSLTDAPNARNRDVIASVPAGDLLLCTPKLDAILAHFDAVPPTSALVFETNRRGARDPRFAGEILERRLHERGVSHVTRVSFLNDIEQLEDSSNDLDAVVRRDVIATLANAIAIAVENLTKGDRVFVATTGGLAAANEVINELVRLRTVGRPSVTAMEVPDRNRVQSEDRAVEERFHPAAGLRARWHALSLIEKGNFLGAWGSVCHLEGAPGQEWTKVISWLSRFASSLPLPLECDLDILRHERMAVRAALRVELALRAGDIPRAVHSTVAFFEAALWDHLGERTSRHPRKRQFSFHMLPAEVLVRERDPEKVKSLSKTKQADDRVRPFIFKETADSSDWYWIDDSEICAVKIARHYLKCEGLTRLGETLKSDIRELRNDVAHNEPTTSLMEQAQNKMRVAGLWSANDTFLSQKLVRDVLAELGVPQSDQLCSNLLSTVRERLVTDLAGDKEYSRSPSSPS